MDVLDVLVLCAFAFLAGALDAVVGGGGLVQLPALLLVLPQVPVVSLLGTNKLASVVGTCSAAVTYARKVPVDRGTAAPMVVAAFLGSALGAALATVVPGSALRPLVLVALVGVLVFTLRRPALGDVQALRFAGGRHLTAALAAALTIGFYDGIFGPGTGSFLVFALVALMGYSFVQASAKARIVNLATNLGALAVFIPQGAPMYGLGLAMAACNVLGGRVGAATAISRGSGFVRAVFLVVVGALILRLAYDVLRAG